MKSIINSTLVTLLVLSTSIVLGQSPKKYLKTGEKFEESKNYKDAKDQYTKAIEMDPKFVDAYIARAGAYESMYQMTDAIQDYNRAVAFDPQNKLVLCVCSDLASKWGSGGRSWGSLVDDF